MTHIKQIRIKEKVILMRDAEDEWFNGLCRKDRKTSWTRWNFPQHLTGRYNGWVKKEGESNAYVMASNLPYQVRASHVPPLPDVVVPCCIRDPPSDSCRRQRSGF